MNRFKSLKNKLIVCTIAIIFVTAVLNLIVGIYSSYTSITQNVRNDLKSISQTAEVAINTSLTNMKENIQSVAQSSDIGNADITQPELMKSLETQRKALGYQSLSLVKSDGTILSGDANLNGKNVAGQEYFKQAMVGKTSLSGTTYDINKNLCIIACAPVSNGGSFHGVVLATLDPLVYSNIIKNIVIGKTGNVFILDKQGLMIANIRPQLVKTRANFIEKAKTDSSYVTSAVVYRHMTEGKSGIEVYSYETGDRICCYAPLKDTDGWSFAAVAPLAEMTSSIWNTVFGLGLSSLLCIVLGIFLSIAIARSIANPISLVSHRLELLADGDLQTDTVEVHAKDETGTLASSLAKTAISLRNYIAEFREVLHGISQGNMCVEIPENFKGDFAPLQGSLASITESLNKMLSEINRSSDQIASGSEQVSSGAQTLAQGATEQAQSVEKLSETVTEISSHIRENAQNAVEASDNMNHVRAEIEESDKQMNAMVSAMDKISHSSSEIGTIIKTIQDIAFQTNILALNAAVEAARPGDAGKGFAVVADEVRNLASKSAEAAKNTAILIENTLSQVKDGSKIVDQTAQSLSTVVDSIQIVSEKVNRISEASSQQSDAVSQVTENVSQISSVVQTNSATAEESAAASEELSGQAQMLKTLTDRFQLKGEDD